MEESKEISAKPENPKLPLDTKKLDTILSQIRSTKKFINREDFLKLLDLTEYFLL